MFHVTHRLLISAVCAGSLITPACTAATAGTGPPESNRLSAAPEATSGQPAEVAVSAAASPAPPGGHAPWPITGCGTYSGNGCAPVDKLVDLVKPTFSNPLEITNPYYPISKLESVVFLGVSDGLPFRSETTLLPETDVIVWDGTPIEVALVQYLAYSDGRIIEVALDRYAQADDGSVWYFGEDVYDYADGTIALTEGTWLAGRDGSPAMIMPAHPKPGDVFRSETVLGIVYEEITIDTTDETFDGPSGKVNDVIVGKELHLDESLSEKIFAPGYGEFSSAHNGDLEAMAVARGVDTLPSPEPSELRLLISAAWGIGEAARLEDWEAIPTIARRLDGSWKAVEGVTPPRIAAAMKDSLGRLTEAIDAKEVDAALQATIEIAQSAIDVQLRFHPSPAVDIARFHLHAQQMRLDASEEDAAGAAAELATMEWVVQRLAGHLTPEDRARVTGQLDALRPVVAAGDLPAAADMASRLASDLRSIQAGVGEWA